MRDVDELMQRIQAVIGPKRLRPKDALQKWHGHLVSHLTLPCEVTGIEDFQWEEFYVIGPGSPTGYARLKKNRPSYRDVFELTAIQIDGKSEWIMFPEDLKACVRRKSDGKGFILGLSELEATSRYSPNRPLLDDYSVWFGNFR